MTILRSKFVNKNFGDPPSLWGDWHLRCSQLDSTNNKRNDQCLPPDGGLHSTSCRSVNYTTTAAVIDILDISFENRMAISLTQHREWE